MDKVKQMPDEVLKEITDISLAIANDEQLVKVYEAFALEIKKDRLIATKARCEFEFLGQQIIISPEEISDVILRKKYHTKQIIETNKKLIQDIWTKAITEAVQDK